MAMPNNIYWNSPKTMDIEKIMYDGEQFKVLVLARDEEKRSVVFASMNDPVNKPGLSLIGKIYVVDPDDSIACDAFSLHSTLETEEYDYYIKCDGTVHIHLPTNEDTEAHYFFSSQDMVAFELDFIRIASHWLYRYAQHMNGEKHEVFNQYFKHHLPEDLENDVSQEYGEIKND